MIHKCINMRALLRDPESNLPKEGETVFVSRQSKKGPQVFALSVASLSASNVSLPQNQPGNFSGNLHTFPAANFSREDLLNKVVPDEIIQKGDIHDHKQK